MVRNNFNLVRLKFSRPCLATGLGKPVNRSGFHKRERPSILGRPFVVCGPDRTRTCHPIIANDVLYQMSYGPNNYKEKITKFTET